MGVVCWGQIPVAAIFSLDIPNFSDVVVVAHGRGVAPANGHSHPAVSPPSGKTCVRVLRSSDKRPLYQVVASGSFLFLSQVLIYKAIADVGPGVAVTLLFMYPLITVPLAWFLFGDRPTPLRLVVMFAISMGIVFTALPPPSHLHGSGRGQCFAVGRGCSNSGQCRLCAFSGGYAA